MYRSSGFTPIVRDMHGSETSCLPLPEAIKPATKGLRGLRVQNLLPWLVGCQIKPSRWLKPYETLKP